jgi:polysaccharide biosynthesis/export protein
MNRISSLAGMTVVVAILVVTSACAGHSGPRIENRSDSTQDDVYRIGPADILDIRVWREEDLSGTVPVRPDGKISLPLLNDVQAAGLTPMQLRRVLIDKFSDYVTAPEVSVIVTEVHSLVVSVLGEVREPGRYEIRNSPTVLEVIALAGGFTEFASTSRITILRANGGNKERIRVNYSDAIRRGEMGSMVVRPGDIIVVR